MSTFSYTLFGPFLPQPQYFKFSGFTSLADLKDHLTNFVAQLPYESRISAAASIIEVFDDGYNFKLDIYYRVSKLFKRPPNYRPLF